MGPDFWRGLLSRRCDGTQVMEPETSERPGLPAPYPLRSVSLRAPEQLILPAEGMIRGMYGNIIHAKGTVDTGGVPLRLDIADGRYTICGAEQGDGKMVFIGTDIDRARLDAVFHPAKPLRRPRRIQYRK